MTSPRVRSRKRRSVAPMQQLRSWFDVLETRTLLTANVFKTITIDGDMSDWANVPSYSDPSGNTHDTDHTLPTDTPSPVRNPDVDLLEYKVAYDASNIYFYFRAAGQIGRTQQSGPGLAAGRSYIIVTMDTDQSNATGYELSEGGYYPTSNGYDFNTEIEFYDGTFNSANYLNHGASNSSELNQAFLDQSSGQWVSGNDGPYPAGFADQKFGHYDYYTEWVYHDNNTLTFVRDKGPVVLGVATESISADGHSLEMKFPYVGFLKDSQGNSNMSLGRTLDLSFSLEASSELSPDHQWASNTAAPILGFHMNAPSHSSVGTVRNGRFYLDQDQNYDWNASAAGTDTSFAFGNAGDIPITGDWNADGFDDIGVVRNGVWYLDANGNQKWDGTALGDMTFKFGNPGDKPVVGDWNNDGRADIGVVRNGVWYLDMNGDHKWGAGDATFNFGIAGDTPVTGDWNGDGTTDIGVYRSGSFYLDSNPNHYWDGGALGDVSFKFGAAGDKPMIGDWNQDGISDVGVFRNGQYYLDSNGNHAFNSVGDKSFRFGNATDIPLGGRWIQPIVLTTASSSAASTEARLPRGFARRDRQRRFQSSVAGSDVETARLNSPRRARRNRSALRVPRWRK
ncbi:MAG: hypothetical protein U0903_16385 [Planctomycetales bacterium]